MIIDYKTPQAIRPKRDRPSWKHVAVIVMTLSVIGWTTFFVSGCWDDSRPHYIYGQW